MTTQNLDIYHTPNFASELADSQLIGLQIVSMGMQQAIDRNPETPPIESTPKQAEMIDEIAIRPLKYATEVEDKAAWEINVERVKVLDQLIAYPQLFKPHYADYIGMGDGKSHGALSHQFTSAVKTWHGAYTDQPGQTAAICIGNVLSDLKYSGDLLSARARQQRIATTPSAGNNLASVSSSPEIVIPTARAEQVAAVGALATSKMRIPLRVEPKAAQPKPWYIPGNTANQAEASWGCDSAAPVAPHAPDPIVSAIAKGVKLIQLKAVEALKPTTITGLSVLPKADKQPSTMPSKVEIMSGDELKHLTKLWEENVSLSTKKRRTLKGRKVSIDVMQHDLKDFTNKVQEEVANIMHRHRELGTSLDHIKATLKPRDSAAKLAFYVVRDMTSNNLQEA